MPGAPSGHSAAAGKGLEIGFGLMLEPDHAEGDKVEAELRAVQHGVIALDDARLFQLAHPAQAGRRGNADPVGKLDIGHAPVRCSSRKIFMSMASSSARRPRLVPFFNSRAQLLYKAHGNTQESFRAR